MKIKAIFWDNDGVLVDTERLYFAATKQVLAEVGVDLTKEMYTDLLLVRGKGAWHLAVEKGLSKIEADKLRDKRNEIYSRLLSQDHLVIDGAEEVLKNLHGKFIMGMVTSSRRDHFDIIHRSSGLLSYFDFVLTGEDYSRHKPDPEPYLAAVKKSGCKKQDCLAIEDSERGLTAAKAAGIQCYIIPTELTSGGNFSRADKILKSIKDVEAELL
jgi:HAD superfamily hydrolase (TIGR01509 family)